MFANIREFDIWKSGTKCNNYFAVKKNSKPMTLVTMGLL